MSIELVAVTNSIALSILCPDDEGMAHPSGGSGGQFKTAHTFAQAYIYVGTHGIRLRSTTGGKIIVTRGTTRDGEVDTLVFNGDNGIRHGSACAACWGYRKDCSGSRIGHCAEPLDENIH